MNPIKAWNSFFRQFETDKARLMRFWLTREMVHISEFISGEYVCTRCNMSTLVPELPGEFKDFDADPDRGGDGIAICKKCVGTGKYKKTKEFKQLQQEAEEARNESSRLFGELCQNKDWPWYKGEIRKVNDRMIEISRKALLLVTPTKNCLASEIAKKK